MIYSGGEEERKEEKKKRMKRKTGWQPFMCEGIQRIGAIEQGVMDECNAQPARTPFSEKNTVTLERDPFRNIQSFIAHPPIQSDYSAALKELVDG